MDMEVIGAEIGQISKPSKKDVLDMLQNMIETYDKIPPYAMHAPVSNADLLSVLLLMQAIATIES